jgi:hypothetical protein
MGAYLDTGVKVDPNGGGRRVILFQGLGESVEEWKGGSYLECRHTGRGPLSKGLDVIANIYVKIAYIAIGIEVIVVPNAQSWKIGAAGQHLCHDVRRTSALVRVTATQPS